MKHFYLLALSSSAFIASFNPTFAHNNPKQQFHKPLPDGTTIEHVHKIVGPSAKPQKGGPKAVGDTIVNICSGEITGCINL